MAKAFLRAALLAALALAANSGAASAQYQPPAPPDGPIFTPEQMQAGTQMTAQDCAAYRRTVFVEAQGVGICFRYYISDAGGNADEAVYWLEGDRAPERLAYDPATFERSALRMSRRYRRPAIYLARQGLDGSSGWHRGWRRTFFEVEATNRAISAINARHGFRRVHVMGQSGGAHLTAGLIALRRDIGCAVPGAGPLAFPARANAQQLLREPFLRFYDPASRIHQVAIQSQSTRILVVADARDRVVRLALQTEFVERLRQLGGQIGLFLVSALDERHHGATPYTREAMAGCLAGASDTEIEAMLQRYGAFFLTRRAAREAGRTPPSNYGEAVQPIQVPPAGAAPVARPSDTPPGTMPAMPRTAGPTYTSPSTISPPPPPGSAAPVRPYEQRYYR